MSTVISTGDLDIESYLNQEKTLLVDFWAPNCAPCRMLEPNLASIADSFSPRVQVLKVNVNENPRTSARFQVRSLPTLIFIKDGKVRSQLIGAVNQKKIEAVLQDIV